MLVVAEAVSEEASDILDTKAADIVVFRVADNCCVACRSLEVAREISQMENWGKPKKIEDGYYFFLIKTKYPGPLVSSINAQLFLKMIIGIFHKK